MEESGSFSDGEGYEVYESFLMGETEWGKLGPALMGRVMFRKSLIKFSVDGWSCVPSLLFTWGLLWWK